MVMENYEHLEGKIIDYTYDNSTIPGLVVGVDRDIGITIVREDDHDRFLLCINGPSSGHSFYKNDYSIDLNAYNEIFDFAVAGLERGVHDANAYMTRIINLGLGSGVNPTLADCPYNR